MPSPKDGTPGTLVSPTLPDEAHDADNAVPGEVEAAKAAERQSGTGKYGTQPVPAYNPATDTGDPEKKKSWIGLKLLDTKGKPVAGEKYTITLGDGRVITGSTGADGSARHNGLDPGSAKISFPDLDNDAVKPK